jgi:hypothetical protein
VTGFGEWCRARAMIPGCATPRKILVAGYLLFLLYAYPGYLGTESVDQLVDARAGSFTDWYSPVMSEVWRLVEWVVTGPFGMLALQSTLLLGGAYHLFRRVVPARAAAIAACGMLVFPPVLAPIAVVWRDSQMAGYLLAGAAAVTSSRRAIRLVGLGLILLACAMRDAAVFAALPVVVLGFAWRDGQRWWARGAVAAAAWAAIAIGAAWLNGALADAVTERPGVALAASDIAGVLRYSAPIDDARLARELAGTGVVVQGGAQALYARSEAASDGGRGMLGVPDTPEGRASLFAARRALLLAHRGAYLTARWHVFYRLLGLSSSVPAPVYASFVESPGHRAAIGHAATHGWVQRLLVKCVRPLGGTFLFRPYLYLIAAFVLLPIVVITRQRDTAMVLASGIAYELSWFFLAATADYRLSHWMILCSCLAAALLIARRVIQPR